MSITNTDVERHQPVMTEVERTTLLGFLAGYRGYTREPTRWICVSSRRGAGNTTTGCFDVRRVDIECFARDLEDRGRARATVARRLCTVVGFYVAPKRRVSSNTHPQCIFAGRASTTSPTSPTSTAMSSAPCWSPPGCRRPVTTPWCRCSR